MRMAVALVLLLTGCTEFCGHHPLVCGIGGAVVTAEVVTLIQRKGNGGPSCVEISGGARPGAAYCPPVPPGPK